MNLIPKTPKLVLDFNAPGGIAAKVAPPPQPPAATPSPNNIATQKDTAKPPQSPTAVPTPAPTAIPPQLAAELLSLRTDNARLVGENQALKQRITELESKVGRFHLLETT